MHVHTVTSTDDEETNPDEKSSSDDVLLGEPVTETHSTSVAAGNVVQALKCVDDSRQQELLPPSASLSDVAAPVPNHSPVPLTSPAQSF